MTTWDQYNTHPEIGPLIEQYRHQVRELEYVKQGLRDNGNIDEIMQISFESAEIKRLIDGLVEREEIVRSDRRRDSLWLVVTFLAVAVGAVNIAVALGLF